MVVNQILEQNFFERFLEVLDLEHEIADWVAYEPREFDQMRPKGGRLIICFNDERIVQDFVIQTEQIRRIHGDSESPLRFGEINLPYPTLHRREMSNSDYCELKSFQAGEKFGLLNQHFHFFRGDSQQLL